MKVVSLFSGAGGLDRGFEDAGMEIIWANEFDKKIEKTYRHNFPNTHLDTRSIVEIGLDEIPDCDGIIGGPPCQSWSVAGAHRGINDERGMLLYKYLDIIEAKKPKFFLIENVPGLINKRNLSDVSKVFVQLTGLDYNVIFGQVNAADYGVPQSRKRVFCIGYSKEYGKVFSLPEKSQSRPVLKDSIWDLRKNAVKALDKNKTNKRVKVPNHEYLRGGFSYIYMSRNRVRAWDEPSFTIQASGRHAPCHPNAPKMEFVRKDEFQFVKNKKYRRLTVRECARIQTFPDDFIFIYDSVNDGYKMVGNAVPIMLSKQLALQIKKDLSKARKNKKYINYDPEITRWSNQVQL